MKRLLSFRFGGLFFKSSFVACELRYLLSDARVDGHFHLLLKLDHGHIDLLLWRRQVILYEFLSNNVAECLRIKEVGFQPWISNTDKFLYAYRP
jgi:hypothetical protein